MGTEKFSWCLFMFFALAVVYARCLITSAVVHRAFSNISFCSNILIVPPSEERSPNPTIGFQTRQLRRFHRFQLRRPTVLKQSSGFNVDWNSEQPASHYRDSCEDVSDSEESEGWPDGECDDDDRARGNDALVDVDKEALIEGIVGASDKLNLGYSRANLENMEESELEVVMRQVVDRKDDLPAKPSVMLLSRQQMIETLLLYKKRLPDYIRNSPTKMRWLQNTASKEEIREIFEECIFCLEHDDGQKARHNARPHPNPCGDDPHFDVDIDSAPALSDLKALSEAVPPCQGGSTDLDSARRLLLSNKRDKIESLIWQHRSALPDADMTMGDIRSLDDSDLLAKLRVLVKRLTEQ